MATIEIRSPEEDVVVDCFTISFDGLSYPSPFGLLVTIQDQYPVRKLQQAVITSETDVKINITNAEVTIIRNQHGEATASISAPESNVTTTSNTTVTTQSMEAEPPEFQYRKFYYRLTNDSINLGTDNNSNALPKDWVDNGNSTVRQEFNPAGYRVVFINENGIWKGIYRFNISVETQSVGLFHGNNLLEILLHDDNGKEIFLCSADINTDANVSYAQKPSAGITVVGKEHQPDNPEIVQLEDPEGSQDDSHKSSQSFVHHPPPHEFTKPGNTKQFRRKA